MKDAVILDKPQYAYLKWLSTPQLTRWVALLGRGVSYPALVERHERYERMREEERQRRVP